LSQLEALTLLNNLISQAHSNCDSNIITIALSSNKFLTIHLVMNSLAQLPYETLLFIEHQNTWHHMRHVHHYLPCGRQVYFKWDWDNPPWHEGITVRVTHIRPVITPGRNFRQQYKVNYPEESGTESDETYSDSDQSFKVDE
jgi:hypothetical protein